LIVIIGCVIISVCIDPFRRWIERLLRRHVDRSGAGPRSQT
jgi:hypothetical protein